MDSQSPAVDRESVASDRALDEMWREALVRGKDLSFRVMSHSMSPLIQAGDVVGIVRVDPAHVNVGDVVALHVGREVVVHRLIGKWRSAEGLQFHHRGDAGAGSGTVAARHLIGRAFKVEREGRLVRLDSTKKVLVGKILGRLMRLDDASRRVGNGRLIGGLRLVIRPWWRMSRGVLLRACR